MTLEELYAAYKDTLIKKLTAYSRDAHAAEDAVQQAYLNALAHGRLAGMPNESARAWLYVAAKNALTDDKRKLARLSMLETDIEIQQASPDKSDMLLLHDLLERLPQEQRQIVTLRYLTGLNSVTIGKMLGIPPATVRTRLRAALKKLRHGLDPLDSYDY